MTIYKYTNNAVSELAVNLDSTSTTMYVKATEGSKFPSEFPFVVTVWNFNSCGSPENDTNMEIMLVTGRTDDTFTVTRGHEGTTGVAHNAIERVALMVTADTFSRIQTEFDTTNGNLSTHESDTSTHGVTEVIGADEVQTLTNKTLVTPEVDVINESTSGVGVTIDGILLKDGLVDGRDLSVDGSKLDGIESSAKDDQNASEVPFTPTGDISSTDVQSAIAELDTEKETPTGAQTKVDTHAALTSTHGVTGDILGTEDKDVNSGVAALDSNGSILSKGDSIFIPRNVSDEIYMKERTSNEAFHKIDRSSATYYDEYIRQGAGWEKIQHTGMKDIANGYVGIDGSGNTEFNGQVKVDISGDQPFTVVPNNDTPTSTHALSVTNAANTAYKFNVDNAGNITAVGTVDGRDISTDGSTLDAIVNDIDYPTTVKQKLIVGSGEDGGVEGGVFNGDFEYGSGYKTSAGWIGSEDYGWRAYIASGSAELSYDNTVSYSGTQSLKLKNTNSIGKCYAGMGALEGTINRLPMIAGQKYRLSGMVKGENVQTDGAYININMYDADDGYLPPIFSEKLSGTFDWTYIDIIFTANASAVYGRATVANYTAGAVSTAWFDDIKLEQIDTQTVNTQVATPASVSVTGVTTTDNVDQSQTSAAGGTSLGRISTKYHSQSFLNGETSLTGITFRKAPSFGTFTGDIVVSIESDDAGDPSGTVLSSSTILNATWEAYSNNVDIFLELPCKLNTGQSYWIVFSSSTADDSNYTGIYVSSGEAYGDGVNKYSADGTTWNTSTNDVYFKTHFAKHTESPIIESNGGKLDLTGTKLLTGATITVNNDGSGKYSWMVREYGDYIADIHEFTIGGAINAYPYWSTNRRIGFTLGVEFIFDFNTYLINTGGTISYKVECPAGRSGDVSVSDDNINWTTHHYTNADDGVAYSIPYHRYVKFGNAVGSWVYLVDFTIEATLDCTNVQLPSFVPSSEAQTETLDLVQNQIDISEGHFWKLKNDLTGWSSRTITMLSSEATFESQVVSASTIYVYDTNGTSAWTWDSRNGLVPPADRTSGTVMVKYLVGDNQIKSSVNDGSMKANFSLAWDEESLRAAINRLTEIANLQYPIVVEVDDVPSIDIQLEPTGATANTGYTNDITSLRQTTAGVAGIAYTGLTPAQNRFSEWLDIVVECDDGDGVLQGKLYTEDGTLVETYADIMANSVMSISNPDYKYSRERLILQISASTETTSTAWSVTGIKWRYQYNG